MTAAAPAAPETEPKAAPGKPTTYLLEKQDPSFPWTWRPRHFVIDHDRGALTYSEDEAQKAFKGAIPLEMIAAVTPSKTGVSVDIADRTFVLRPPKDAAPEVRDAFVSALVEAVASHPSDGPGEVDKLPRSHWKDAERYRERQRTTKEERGGKLSRQAKDGYPERARPMTLDWAVELPGYAPPSFTVERNAINEPATPTGVEWSQRASWTGPLQLHEGAPRNPIGRTGLCGRGVLPRWGPNQEARTLVTKQDQAGGWHVVVVRKAGEQRWLLPGGLLPRNGEAPPPPRQLRMLFALQACSGKTRLNEEALAKIFVDESNAAASSEDLPVPTGVGGRPPTPAAPAAATSWVHLGFCDDSANTDQAWLESAVAHFHAPVDAGADLTPFEGPGLAAARWMRVPTGRGPPAPGTAGFWPDLHPVHQRWVLKAIMQHGVAQDKLVLSSSS